MKWGSLNKLELEIHKKRYDDGKKDTAFYGLPTGIHILSEPYWEAFWCLHRGRSSDMSGNPSALSFCEIKAWLDLFPEHDITIFIYLISAMDGAYLSYISKKQDKEEKSTKK